MARLSESGYEFLKSVEGVRLVPYKDGKGRWAVGFGHNGPDVKPGKKYTEAEIKKLFDADKVRFEKDVNKIFDEKFMNQNMFDACFSFAYNVGNISSTDLGRMIAANPYDDRLRAFWAYTYTDGGRNRGLVNRRKKEALLYFS